MILRTTLLALCAVALVALPQRAPAITLEIAFVIDGSGSISGPNGSLTNPPNVTIPPDYGDWGLQLDAYRNIFQNNFYTNIVGPSNVDTVVAAAYIFFESRFDSSPSDAGSGSQGPSPDNAAHPGARPLYRSER